MPARNRVQALVPEGALVLANPNGTAPGLVIEVTAGRWLIMLPGPPRELRPMFTNHVAPLIRRVLPLRENFICRTLRTTGIGESLVEERIGEALKPFVAAGGELGYCARTWQVDVRLAARGPNAAQLVSDAEAQVRERLGSFIYSEQEEELEAIVVKLFTERKLTLALAESCTGGGIANRLTNVPGASAVLIGGFVTYSNALKQTALGVRSETLAALGAVSEAVAREMADGARRATGADYAISVTGIAGPDGGTPEKPVGTVFIGLATPEHTVVERCFNPYDRETFKTATANQVLEKLRRAVMARQR